jgi:hypothetical protein
LRREVAIGARGSAVVRSSYRQCASGVRLMCHRGHGLAVRVRRNSHQHREKSSRCNRDHRWRPARDCAWHRRRVSGILPLHRSTLRVGRCVTSFIRLMANRRTGTTSVPRLRNLRVRGFGRCRLRTISCPTGFPSTNKPGLWDTCSSSVRLRQASCFSSWQVARSSSDSPLEPADSAVRTTRPVGRCE